MDEQKWDKRLRISTCGRDAARSDAYRYPYEPTPYCVLQRLADSGLITRNSVVLDYGCGKGRVGFFLNHSLGCRTVGVEYDPEIYRQALDNLASSGAKNVSFVCTRAEQYVPDSADCFYFFNPFSPELLRPVLGKILESWYENSRPMRLFFYYPSDEYISLLMTDEHLQFEAEIDCRDLFSGGRERILVFHL